MSTDDKDIGIYIKEYYDYYYSKQLTNKMGEKLNINFNDSSLSGQKKWINAFGFILEHLMMRGRPDKLSYNYTNFYMERLQLDNNVDIESLQKKINILSECLESLQKEKRGIESDEFTQKFEGDSRNTFNIKYLNKNDIRMVKSLLCFQKKIFEKNKNIFDYLVTLMSEDSVIAAYQRLTKIDYVADKLAAFTLRDIMFLSEKSKTIKLKPYDYLILFPIDTRVNQKAMEILGIDKKLTKTNKTNKIDPLILKIRLINLCEEQGFIEKDPLAPLKLNAGMWYNFENNKSKN